MNWSYKHHLKIEKVDCEYLFNHQDRVTWLTFDQWLAFYHGDPEHWYNAEGSFRGEITEEIYYGYLPVYKKDKYNKNEKYHEYEYIYIKFLTRLDFKKYKKYIKTITKKGEDFENLCEIEELARHIGKIADERLRETQKRTQQAIDENEKLMKEAKLRLQKEIQKDQEGRWMWQ